MQSVKWKDGREREEDYYRFEGIDVRQVENYREYYPGDRGPGTHKRIQFSRGNTGETITTLYRGGRRKYTFEEEVPCLHNETIRFITRSIEIFYLFDLCFFLYINCLKCLCLSLLPLQLHELNTTIKLIVSSITR